MERRVAVFVCCVLAAVVSAGADPLLISNTGDGLAEQAPDLNYTYAYWNTDDLATALTTLPTMTNMPMYVVLSQGLRFPFDPTHWMQNTELSQWIAPKPYYADSVIQSQTPRSDLLSDPVGIYRIRYTIDLTGYDSSTAAILGRWSPDNGGLGIYVNGVDAGHTAPWSDVGTPAFETWSAFDLTASLFQPGVNTIDFYVYNKPDPNNPNNWGNPVGVRVEWTGSADPWLIPEPASLVLSTLGLAGIVLIRRKFAH